MAKALNKPFYVAAESYKFTRDFSLGQEYLKDEGTVDDKEAVLRNSGRPLLKQNMDSDIKNQTGLTVFAPKLDYTPPDCISYLLTDLGVMTTNGVSEELIKQYY